MKLASARMDQCRFRNRRQQTGRDKKLCASLAHPDDTVRGQASLHAGSPPFDDVCNHAALHVTLQRMNN